MKNKKLSKHQIEKQFKQAHQEFQKDLAHTVISELVKREKIKEIFGGYVATPEEANK